MPTPKTKWPAMMREMEEILRPDLLRKAAGTWITSGLRAKPVQARSSAFSSALMCMAAFAPSAAATIHTGYLRQRLRQRKSLDNYFVDLVPRELRPSKSRAADRTGSVDR